MFVRCSRLPVFPIFLSCLFFLFFFFNHDREKHFVAPSEYNGARAPHVCLPTRGILIGNAIITSVIIPIPNDQGSLLLSLYSRFSLCIEQAKNGYGWNRNTVLHRDHIPCGTSEAATAGIRAVHARTLSPFLCPGTICYFVHIHNAVTSSRTDAFSTRPFPSLFFPSLFPPARTRTLRAVYCSSIPALSLNSQEGFNTQTAAKLRNFWKIRTLRCLVRTIIDNSRKLRRKIVELQKE